LRNFTFHFPTKIVFGRGELERLGELTESHGRRAMVVTGSQSMRQSGFLVRATSSLKAAGVDVVFYEGVPPNPTCAVVDEIGDLAASEGCDVIIGLGGGSAMDAAKAAAVAATHEGPIWRYAGPGGDKPPITDATLPFIGVPSTAGTGSEATAVAVISNPETQQKVGFRDPHMFPVLALVDPELTFGAPADLTAATGMDALAHAIEAFLATRTQPISEMFADAAGRLIAPNLRRLARDLHDQEARVHMSWASLAAGVALSGTGGGVMHALEHPISGHFPHVPHGAGLTALMLAYFDWAHEAAAEKFAIIAEWLGEDTTGLSTSEAAARSVGALRRLMDDIGFTTSLADLGVAPDAIETIARDAASYMTRGIENSPRKATVEDLVEILRKSL
jgi:alcohol dehydrogenase